MDAWRQSHFFSTPHESPMASQPEECEPRLNRKDVEVRLATDADHDVIRALYREGLLDGQIRENDTGADIENLREGYFSDDGASAFWVACHKGDVIGMIGLQKTKDDTAEMRRLRVRRPYRRQGAGTLLIEEATNFCRKHGYLKVVLDVRIERKPAIALFQSLGFTLARDLDDALEFYLNIYADP
jgi:ribosomal protein S18 acetylase RimI-like enzyme